MDNYKKLSEGLLKADGIDPTGATESERMAFGIMLDEQSNLGQSKPSTPWPDIWRIIMKNPVTKIAAAAVIIIACSTGLILWERTGSGIALADVLARVEQAKAFRCKGTFTLAGEPVPGKPYHWELRGEVLTSREWGRKGSREVPDPSGGKNTLLETYFCTAEKTMVEISHAQKRYTRTELDDVAFQYMQEGLVEDNNPVWFLRGIMRCKYESLGRSTLEGTEVEGFRTTDPNYGPARGLTDPQVDAKLWVDAKTQMPVRFETLVSGLARRGGKMSNHSVLQDIQWDVPVTAADFAPPPVPEGYLAVVDKRPGPLTEEAAIQALRQCVEWLGKYPANFRAAPLRGIQSELDASDSPAAVRLKEELKGLTEQDRINRLMEAGTPLRRVDRFFFALSANRKDPAYYGNIVTPQDADKVLMRWKVSDNEYRVIYGDLRAETVSPEKLAELEKTLPK